MIWITIWIQDPEYVPDYMDWWHSIFDVITLNTTLWSHSLTTVVSQQTLNVCMTFIQCWTNVQTLGRRCIMLYKYFVFAGFLTALLS